MRSRATEILSVPYNFGIVEDGIYRCGCTLEESHIPYLKTLGLKTVLIMSAEEPSRPFLQFIEENNIQK
ncbi:hypothetical protein EV182_003386, partial [Spiromyces aspiralis]